MINVGADSPVRAKLEERAFERDLLLSRLTQISFEDSRVAAAWLYGSLARGDSDALSDIDARLVFRDDHMEQALSTRREFIALVAEPIMILEAPQNRPPGGAYNMAWYPGVLGPHAIDLTWSSSSLTQIPSGVKVLHNRAELMESGDPMPFAHQPVPTRDRLEEMTQALHGFWSMLLVVAKCAARNPFEERMDILQWTVPQLREVQQFAGCEPGPAFDALDPHPAPDQKMAILRRLAADASALTELLAQRGVLAPAQFEPQAQRFLDLVQAVMLEAQPL